MTNTPTLSSAESIQSRGDDYTLSSISLSTSEVGLTAYITMNKPYPNRAQSLHTIVKLPDELREQLYAWVNAEKTNMIWER